MGKGEFFEVSLFVGFGFGELDALGEKILGHHGLNLIGVFFFVVDPADELVGIFRRVFRKFCDLFHRFSDSGLVGLEVGEHGFI